jgi:hypothetical protein
METTFGQTPLQRHLAAFKADLVIAASSSMLALMATTGGLAKAGANAASDPALVWTTTGSRLESIQTHDLGLLDFQQVRDFTDHTAILRSVSHHDAAVHPP